MDMNTGKHRQDKEQIINIAILRYQPSPLTGEFANVGVLLWDSNNRTLLFRLSENNKRLKTFFGYLDEDYLRACNRLEIEHLSLAKYLRLEIITPNLQVEEVIAMLSSGSSLHSTQWSWQVLKSQQTDELTFEDKDAYEQFEEVCDRYLGYTKPGFMFPMRATLEIMFLTAISMLGVIEFGWKFLLFAIILITFKTGGWHSIVDWYSAITTTIAASAITQAAGNSKGNNRTPFDAEIIEVEASRDKP
jgi:hypothetical protein